MVAMNSLVLGTILLALQAGPATLVGTVRDGESGQPLSGVLVALTDLDRAVLTDSAGRYGLHAVPAGPQHITVRLLGYGKRTLHALVPREGQLEINIALSPEPIPLRALDVRRVVAVRGVEKDSTPFPDRGISIQGIRAHPLLAEPDVFLAVSGGEVVVKPESPTGLHIRGGASDQTAYVLDGVPVFSPYHVAGVFSAWNPDAIARLQVLSSAPSPALPDALSGVVSAETRAPAVHLQTQGSVSTAQARMTIDGPLGAGGFLLSLRTGFPAGVTASDEPSYLRGETGDWLAKLEYPLLGGRIRLLGYESENEIDAAATADAEVAGTAAGRHGFEWLSRSAGAEWVRAFSGASVRVQAWTAAVTADARWKMSSAARTGLAAQRRDEGVLATLERSDSIVSTLAGIRLERSRTSYRIAFDDAAREPVSMDARTPLATAFAQHTRRLGSRFNADVAASLMTTGSTWHVSPRAQLRWLPADNVTLSGSYARLHQFAQSVRNPESVVGSIFPVDLFIGAGARSVPVARSEHFVLGADYRPAPGIRLAAQAYAKDLENVLLVAAGEAEPFATGSLRVGSGAASGFSVDAAASSTHFGFLASYGWQHVRYQYGSSSYVPDFGTSHIIDIGGVAFPSPTWSIRLNGLAAIGRYTTSIPGALEWESCNLIYRGCEFAGTPHYSGESLGSTSLPIYLRIDLGVRKHWHVDLAGRDALLAVFATVTNLLGRTNVLTWAVDPTTGTRTAIEMLPLSPLVVGLDWRF
jgi:hypothetical protein